MDPNGKVVLVTGASGGIGRAAALMLAQAGAKVALAARSAERLDSLAKELPDALAIPTDVRDPDAVRTLVARVLDRYGRIDILVNNTGQGMGGRIDASDLDEFRRTFELNVVGAVVAMQAVVPAMREQGGGSVVNVSSGTTKMTVPGVGPYAST